MTNREKLNKMSNTELGEFLANFEDNEICLRKVESNLCCFNCSDCYSNWLSSEVTKYEIE